MTSLTLYRFIKHHFKRCKGSNNSTNIRKKSLYFCFSAKNNKQKGVRIFFYPVYLMYFSKKRGNVNNVFLS